MDKIETLIQGNFEFHRLNSVASLTHEKSKTENVRQSCLGEG